MFVPGVFGVGLGLGVGRGPGVALEPFVGGGTGGREDRLCTGVPFKTAAAPSSAVAAPLIENA